MPARRLVDISPPKPKQKAQKEKPSLKLRAPSFKLKFSVPSKTKVIASGSVLLALLLFFSLHVLLAKAKVTITPVSREIVLEEMFSVEPGTASSVSEKTIAGTLLEQEQSGTKLFSSTGKENQETKAQGTIRVFNNQAKTQILIAQTRFISEDGKLFRSTSRITIESGGFTDVAVLAAEPGSSYNIGPSNFSLPGLLGSATYTLVYGKSSQQMTGGGKTEVSVVTEADLRSAEESFAKELLAGAKDQLYKSAIAPMTIINESLREEVVKASSSVQAGAPISQFHVTGKVKVRALAFSQEELQGLVKEVLTLGVQKGEKLQEQTLRLSQESATFASATQKALLELEIRAKVYQDIDREELQSSLLEKSKAEAQQLLLDYPQIEKFEFSFFPFWKQALGSREERVDVTMVLPGD
ncbi:MAG: hypothetical protein A3J68_01950 [Candidatus Wildermuthbacteria bacterium RIFCSPHIGHO2_02_FULL_48_16]|uniref:Baseplate protein J-like barrel domain-containing protein n=1 Tax=Candidatus Wildermuthbacteria bacterium RIFCSPHIGHO2_02_FULL_48_16 TaxID=1802453 RepID=A0A1G2R866_9BACT|nr:MAG: hypothetical protein A3J68_01950 [Candidatus Wildermuthbacteria bacterium RIFCSPHIGHO2_02_FULL_48_16]